MSETSGKQIERSQFGRKQNLRQNEVVQLIKQQRERDILDSDSEDERDSLFRPATEADLEGDQMVVGRDADGYIFGDDEEFPTNDRQNKRKTSKALDKDYGKTGVDELNRRGTRLNNAFVAVKGQAMSNKQITKKNRQFDQLIDGMEADANEEVDMTTYDPKDFKKRGNVNSFIDDTNHTSESPSKVRRLNGFGRLSGTLKRGAATAHNVRKSSNLNDIDDEFPMMNEFDDDDTNMDMDSTMPPKPSLALPPKPSVKSFQSKPEEKIEEISTADFSKTVGFDSNDAQIRHSGNVLDNLEVKKDATSQFLRFYLVDIHEENDRLFLFGKVPKAHQSNPKAKTPECENVCITVMGSRSINFLMRPDEIDDSDKLKIAMNEVIGHWKRSRDRCLNVPRFKNKVKTLPYCDYQINYVNLTQKDKAYAFELPDIPRERSKYFVMEYNSMFPPIDVKSGKCFSHVFGANSSLTENFLLSTGIKGPSWLCIRPTCNEFSNYAKNQIKAGNGASIPKHYGQFFGLRPHEMIYQNHVIELPAVKCITPLDLKVTPELSAISMSIKTAFQNNGHQIAMVSLCLHQHIKIDEPSPTTGMKELTLICSPNSDVVLPPQFDRCVNKALGGGYEKHNVQKREESFRIYENESELLEALLEIIKSNDPDMLIGHNNVGFDLDTISNRLKILKILHPGKLGRINRRQVPEYERTKVDLITSGRLLVDSWISSKELVRETEYSLSYLVKKHLKINHEPFQFETLPKQYEAPQTLLNLYHHNKRVAQLALLLVLKLDVIPLTKQITNEAGNTWNRTLRGNRSERVEYLLLHEFYGKDYLLPEKYWQPKQKKTNGKKRGKASYSGGLVLDPKVGLYDKYILLLDFNSLYPSIIREFNLCFTTVSRPPVKLNVDEENENNKNKNNSENGEQDNNNNEVEDDEHQLPDFPAKDMPDGLLPRIVTRLLEARAAHRSKIKTAKSDGDKAKHNIAQLALKILANSMYGCLGFSSSRFFAKSIAAMITSKGRELLMETKTIAENDTSLEVIYGDTDSIMLYTNSLNIQEVLELGKRVTNLIAKRYKILRLGIDGYFRMMLLLKKKKYAALLCDENGNVSGRELKGLDMVRRDWCELSREVGRRVVNEIFTIGNQRVDEDGDTIIISREEAVTAIHNMMQLLSEEVRAGKCDNSLVITKGLTKMPNQYNDIKGQAHVQVAARMLKRGETVQAGSVIKYVICKGESKSAAERAYSPKEMMSSDELKLDYEWYLSQQILPPISRLCEPIEGTSQAQLAEFLGLDSARYRQKYTAEDDWDMTGFMTDDEKFRDCKYFNVKCQCCGKPQEFKGLFSISQCEEHDDEGKSIYPFDIRCGLRCESCNGLLGGPTSDPNVIGFTLNILKVGLNKSCKEHIMRYYKRLLVCKEPTCGIQTHQQPSRAQANSLHSCYNPSCMGEMVLAYSAMDLQHQMEFYKNLFDLNWQKERLYEERLKFMQQHKKVLKEVAVKSELEVEFSKAGFTEEQAEVASILQDTVERILEKSGFYNIDMKELFRFAQ
eukprot:TRINITY_DN3311_c1_g1_i1.p1 TRINITY_DN3311_c1_g1~~TRINITY_DN3311_c1_g1_i1.p1  ORF type:complete len:1529 (-),score=552.50 TRINITY_DN3311_c1_g1_i1:228-4814(-)